MSKLLPNLPIEDLNSENDYLGIIEKGDLIKTFLENNSDEFEEIKMFTLYGEWGSGKSTLMKYLERELKGTFNTFFFEAWEHENDENLALSLLEYVLNKSTDVNEEVAKKILEVGGKLFRGLGRSIKLRIPLGLTGASVSVDPSQFVEEVSKKDTSFLKAKTEFKTEFIRWEDMVTKGKSPDYNIIFIDDLDRCEPENVLNLLSALKLFFTYGKKTIFFCGIDSKAVHEAIKTRYQDIIKSGEYLEKVFDISFNMPKKPSTYKLFSQYFSEDIKYSGLTIRDINMSEKLNTFFNALNFKNPRKLKKVLNRYLLVKEFFKILENSETHTLEMPKIYEEDGICVFDLLFTLYFITLQSFYPDKFDAINNANKRKTIYSNALKSTSEATNLDYQREVDIVNGYLEANGDWITFDSFKKIPKDDVVQKRDKIANLIACFFPLNVVQLRSDSFFSLTDFDSSLGVSEKQIDYYFCRYLLATSEFLMKQEIKSNTSVSYILTLLKMIP